MKKRYHIGIDPGTKTGVAIWDSKLQKFKQIETWKIHQALYILYYVIMHDEENVVMYVEDPTTWKPFGKTDQRHRLQGAGSIKRDFAIWKDFAESMSIEFIPIKLQGTIKKMDKKEFGLMTGWKEQTSEHARDAAMLVFQR